MDPPTEVQAPKSVILRGMRSRVSPPGGPVSKIDVSQLVSQFLRYSKLVWLVNSLVV